MSQSKNPPERNGLSHPVVFPNLTIIETSGVLQLAVETSWKSRSVERETTRSQPARDNDVFPTSQCDRKRGVSRHFVVSRPQEMKA